jgi:hypothetical protein
VQRVAYYLDGSLKAQLVREEGREGVATTDCVLYGPDGSNAGRRVEIDDPTRKQIEKRLYNADGSLDSKSVSYYDQGRSEIERRNYNNKCVLQRRFTWNRDPSGNLTRSVEYSAQDEIQQERLFVYLYDEVGNWTKRTFLTLVLGSAPPLYRPGPFIYRTISYWPEE